MAIIKEKDVRNGETFRVGVVVGSGRSSVQINIARPPRPVCTTLERRSLIKAKDVIVGPARIVRSVIKPVININNKDNIGAAYIGAAYIGKRAESAKPVLSIPPRPPQFSKISLAPIEVPIEEKPVVLVVTVQAEPAASITDVVFVPKVETKTEDRVPNYNLIIAREAYKAAMPGPSIIDAEAETTLVEELSVRKFTFNPRGLWARARNVIKNIGFGVDQFLENVATNLYPPPVYVAEYVR